MGSNPIRRAYGIRAMAERYGCHPRTIKRMVEREELHAPDYLPNGRCIWWSDKLEADERRWLENPPSAEERARRFRGSADVTAA